MTFEVQHGVGTTRLSKTCELWIRVSGRERQRASLKPIHRTRTTAIWRRYSLLQYITDEAVKHPPLVREHDGVATQYRHDNSDACFREVWPKHAYGRSSGETSALHAVAESGTQW